MRLLFVTRRRAVAVEGGMIVPAEGRFDLEIDLGDAEIEPGLINAHDHLHRNHYGRLGQPPYANAYDWAADIQRRHRRHIARRHTWSRREALLAGAWKNLFAGVTTVMHHDPSEADFARSFPIRVAPVASADSIGMSPRIVPPTQGPWCLHLAEGTDAGAAEEIRTAAARGWLGRNLLAVHAVGADGDGVARLRASGAAIIWCPSSNLFLLGRTARADLLAPGVDVLLGSDSYLSGAGDLLDELRFAHTLDLVDEVRLKAAVTTTAAARLGLPVPSLLPGAPADLVVLSAPFLQASARDVQLVMVAGRTMLAATSLARRLSARLGDPRPIRRGNVRRWTWSPTTPARRRYPSSEVEPGVISCA